MTIEQRPGTQRAEPEEGHLTGSPYVEAEWSGGDRDELPHPVRLSGQPHGKTSSWIVVATAFVAFAVAGVALILHAWVLMWICVAIVVAMFPAAMAVRIMDDTVGWSKPTPGEITRGYMTRTATRVREEELRQLRETGAQDSEAKTGGRAEK